MSVRQYIGARYVPRFSEVNNGNWSNVYSYEPLTIVKNGNDYYTSKQRVPVGIAITNTNYWVLTGNYNGAISHLQEQIDDITDIVSVLPDVYDSSKSYSKNDRVIYNGSEYIAIARTTGHSPTDTNYWLHLGSIADQLDALNNTLMDKADLSLFDVTDIPIISNPSLASLGNITITVKQTGKTVMIFLTVSTVGKSNPIPSGSVLNQTTIPNGLGHNIGFGADIVGGTDSGRNTRIVLTQAGMLQMIGVIPGDCVVESSLVVPAAGYI